MVRQKEKKEQFLIFRAENQFTKKMGNPQDTSNTFKFPCQGGGQTHAQYLFVTRVLA